MAIVKDADASFVLTTSTVLALAVPLIESAPELEGIEWIAGDGLSCAADDTWTPLDASGDTLAYLQYTSGSTAAPKGVMISHANVLANVTMLETVCDPVPGETYVTWLPHFHDMGLMSLIGPIYGRFTCYVISPLDFLRRPFYWLQAITRYKAGYSAGPNFAYDLCTRKVTEEERARLDLTSWKLVFNGAEPVRWSALEAFVKRFGPCGFRAEAMCPSYGLAEAVLYVCMSPKTAPPVCLRVKRDALEGHRVVVAEDGDENARELVGCGAPCTGTQVRIVHPERFTLCPKGEIGEIWVSGPGVTRGYWRNPEATEAAFNGRLADSGDGPFLRTGDLGFVRDGNLFVTGRAKDLIIVRGANHYPEDIEGAVSKSHQALRPGCAAAFSVEADGEERLVVVQEVRDEFQIGRAHV
jgi:acyl-CoA synthetase (AMP-forming)/AMP-acid ligase II